MLGYSSVSGLESFPPLTTRASEDFARDLSDRKVHVSLSLQRKKNYCKFEFRLNCMQRVTFH